MTMADLGLTLETERLLLRVPVLADFDRYAEMLASEDAARYIGGTLLRAPAWRKFLQMPGAWLLQGFAMFSVVEKSSGRWLGQMGPWRPGGWPGNEIGYAFHPDAWGQGFAVEAGLAARDWAFETLGWDDAIHCIDPGNVPSQKVAQRLGSRKLGPGNLPPPFEEVPIEIWGQTRAEWMAAKRAQAGEGA
jgi:RimJ/RimL family protein N-acetyltransferase